MKRILLAVLLLLGSSLAAVAQSGTGGIAGTVQDSTSGVLPGATVTFLLNPGTVGGEQVVVTDARGAFQFVRWFPGSTA